MISAAATDFNDKTRLQSNGRSAAAAAEIIRYYANFKKTMRAHNGEAVLQAAV